MRKWFKLEEKLDLILKECINRHDRFAPDGTLLNIARKVCDPNADEQHPLLKTLIDDLETSGFIRTFRYHNDPTYTYNDKRATIKGLTFDGFVNSKRKELNKTTLENELKTHQLKSLKPYRFWLPFGLSIVGLSLGFWQTYRNYTLKQEILKTNSVLYTLTMSYDSLVGQLKKQHHKNEQKDSLKYYPYNR